jgi:hypothetical protein
LLPCLFTQRFADQRNTVCRLAALAGPIEQFKLLLVEAHNHRSSRHPGRRFFRAPVDATTSRRDICSDQAYGLFDLKARKRLFEHTAASSLMKPDADQPIADPTSSHAHFEFSNLSGGDRYKLLIGIVIPRPIAFVTTVDEAGVVNANPVQLLQLPVF